MISNTLFDSPNQKPNKPILIQNYGTADSCSTIARLDIIHTVDATNEEIYKACLAFFQCTTAF